MGCIYRSPSSTTENDYNLWNMLKLKTEAKPSHLVLAGDFNNPDINWDTVESDKRSEHTSQRFIGAVRDSFLHQHVTQPTRYCHGVNPSTLDLVLTSEVNMINHINYLPGLGLSDHVCILFELTVYIAKPEQSETKFCYHKGNYTSINNDLMGINWVTALQGETVEDIWKYLSTELKSAMDAHIPKSCPSKDKKRKIWMNRAAVAKQKKSTWLGNATKKLETLLTTSEPHKRKMN